MSRYIHYSKFDPAKLTIEKPTYVKPKQTDIPPYYVVGLKYNYGTEKEPDLKQPCIEFCEFDSQYGISTGQAKKSEDDDDQKAEQKVKKDDEQVCLTFDSQNEEHMDVFNVITKFYTRCTELIYPIRAEINKPKFNIKRPDDCGDPFPSPFYYKKDKDTKLVIDGTPASLYTKLFQRSANYQTLFRNLDGEVISKKMLMNTGMKFIPTVVFRSVTASTIKINLKYELLTGSVIDIFERNWVPDQTETLEKLRQKYSQQSEILKNKLAKRNMEVEKNNTPQNPLDAKDEEKPVEKPSPLDAPPVMDTKKSKRKLIVPDEVN